MSAMSEIADRLQAEGPDEFPRGYYEYLAEEVLAISKEGPKVESKLPATDHVHTTIHEYKDGVHTEIHESRPVLDVQVSRNISPLEEDEIRRLGGGCR